MSHLDSVNQLKSVYTGFRTRVKHKAKKKLLIHLQLIFMALDRYTVCMCAHEATYCVTVAIIEHFAVIQPNRATNNQFYDVIRNITSIRFKVRVFVFFFFLKSRVCG